MARALALLGLLSAFFATLLCAQSSQAANISLNVTTTVTDGQIDVTVHNTGSSPAHASTVEVELAGKRYPAEPLGDLAAGAEAKRHFAVRAPEKPGSYVAISRVHYTNDGRAMTSLNAIYFDQGSPARLRARPFMRHAKLREHGFIDVVHDKQLRFHLVLPDEIRVTGEEPTARGTRFSLTNTHPELASTYTIYGIAESKPGASTHQSRMISTRLRTTQVVKARSLFNARSLGLLALVSLLLSYVLFRRKTGNGASDPEPHDVALLRWSFSVFTVSFLFFLFHAAYVVPDWFFATFTAADFGHGDVGRWSWRVVRTIVSRLYFDGGDFDYFSTYVHDPLLIYVIVGNYFVLRYVAKPTAASDKYYHLLKSVLTLPQLFSKQRLVHWSRLSRVAVLTLLVKIFYVPLLCSWAINNIFHQRNLIDHFHLDWMQVHDFFIAGLILIDVSIFAFGYLVELPQLDNQIKTVEPTLFGWVVCLACYPPFNSFSFSAFDYPLPGHEFVAAVGFTRYWALALVAMLWFFYAWATVALGVRSSNLTNRGIVDTGPYAYVRHPAYGAKCSLWIIEAIFLGNRNFFMCIGLAMTYGARAWTEERHLSRDPDYIAYKRKVPYRFYPWLY